jgi:RNA polymerase sigma-70 factor, ECF subfamily
MPPGDSFAHLLARLRQGDDEADSQVFQRYARRLIALARARLSPLILQKEDPEDVVQSALRSFFRHVPDGAWDLTGWDNLWSMLAVITVRKCHRRVARFQGPVHDARREVSLSAPPEDSQAGWEVLDREPSPEEAATLAETVEQVMRGLNERERHVFQLALQGYPVPAISEYVGRSEYTVEGVLRRIKRLLQRLRNEDRGEPDA